MEQTYSDGRLSNRVLGIVGLGQGGIKADTGRRGESHTEHVLVLVVRADTVGRYFRDH